MTLVESQACDPANVDAIGAARALHARFHVRRARAVRVELIAAECGAYTLSRHAGRADARVVRAGDVAYLGIADHAWGTPRARFSIAHELAHHLLHRDFDGLASIHGQPRTGREHRVERQADKFAVELLLPYAIVAPLCAMALPALKDVGALARTFETSLTVAGRRWASLSPAACAFVESRGDEIVRAKRSAAFRGSAIGGRRIDPTWGSADAGVEVRVESVAVRGTTTVLTWLSHS